MNKTNSRFYLFFALTLIICACVTLYRTNEQSARLTAPIFAHIVAEIKDQTLNDSDEKITINDFSSLFQPLLRYKKSASLFSSFLDLDGLNIDTFPPLNLNYDGNWNFEDTPAFIRKKMLARPEKFSFLLKTGGSVYYRLVRFPVSKGNGKINLISHQYWYYFPVGKGDIGTLDQRFAMIEIVQILPVKGLNTSDISDEDIQIEAVYLCSHMDLRDSGVVNVQRLTSSELIWERFRPVFVVEGTNHRISSWLSLKKNAKYLEHPKGREKLFDLGHHKDWNNPLRNGQNVYKLPVDGAFFNHPLFKKGAISVRSVREQE